MPQFKEEGAKTNFLKAAEKMGFSVEKRRVKLGELAVVQSEVLESKAKFRNQVQIRQEGEWWCGCLVCLHAFANSNCRL